MFAYCGSNPVNRTDASGTAYSDSNCSFAKDDLRCLAYAAVAIVAVVLTPDAVQVLAEGIEQIATDIYKYAKMFIDKAASRYANQQPRVHHVIPKGTWSHYDKNTQAKLTKLQQMLINAHIDFNDYENLVIMSHGTHKSIHTAQYIDAIYYIMTPVLNGNEAEVRGMLFGARTYASGLDQYANGW